MTRGTLAFSASLYLLGLAPFGVVIVHPGVPSRRCVHVNRLIGTIVIGGSVGRAVDWIGPSQTLAAIAWHRHTSASVMNDGVIDASLRVGHLKNGGLLKIGRAHV